MIYYVSASTELEVECLHSKGIIIWVEVNATHTHHTRQMIPPLWGEGRERGGWELEQHLHSKGVIICFEVNMTQLPVIFIVRSASSRPTNSQSCICFAISLALSVSPSLRHFSSSCISRIIYKTLLLTSFSSNYFSSSFSLSLSSLPLVLLFFIFSHKIVHEITCKLCSK